MGLRHKEYIIYGVQFHPESVSTTEGMNLVAQFSKTQPGWVGEMGIMNLGEPQFFLEKVKLPQTPSWKNIWGHM